MRIINEVIPSGAWRASAAGPIWVRLILICCVMAVGGLAFGWVRHHEQYVTNQAGSGEERIAVADALIHDVAHGFQRPLLLHLVTDHRP